MYVIIKFIKQFLLSVFSIIINYSYLIDSFNIII